MFKLDVAVDVIPMVSGRKEYVAKAGAADGRNRIDDFTVKGSSMRDLFICLVNRMDELQIPSDCEMNIVGEFHPEDLTADDADAWATPIAELRKHDSGLTRFLRKISL